MCGIAGILNHTRDNGNSREILTRMLSAIQHRGPDDSGIFMSGPLLLGHVRLSIIDLKTGSQPLTDSTKRYWITYNGEIFNYSELRKDLERKGCRFLTQSDTEVIVNAYALYGKECLPLFNGQFAFAIWDNVTSELFLARDRVGICPLFYTRQPNFFTFASEIKAILQHPNVLPRISYQALKETLTFWSPISPNTVFQEIYEVPPGCCLTISSKKLDLERYWQLSLLENDHYHSFHNVLGEFTELFNDSVNIRLRADVPVAAYLSGGLDSTATVSVINKLRPNLLNTFSVGFSEPDFDETAYQHEAAGYFNTNHRSYACTNAEIASNFKKVIWHTETPLIRTAPVPMYLLSGFVKKNGIKVVLTGEGADETLAGYDIFKETIIRNFWAKFPDSKIRPLLLKTLYPYIPQIANANLQALKLFFGFRLTDTESPEYSHILRWNNANYLTQFFSNEVVSSLNGYNPGKAIIEKFPSNFYAMTPLAKAQYIETTQFMSGYLLSSQGDRMVLGNGVEGRYPFLDHRLVEFCSKLPDSFKMKGLTEKYLLKKAMEGQIPNSIVKRPKQAYRAPIGQIFFKDQPPWIDEILNPRSITETGLFKPEPVMQLVTKLKQQGKGSETEHMAITAILSSQLWHSMFISENTKIEITALKPKITSANQ